LRIGSGRGSRTLPTPNALSYGGLRSLPAVFLLPTIVLAQKTEAAAKKSNLKGSTAILVWMRLQRLQKQKRA